MKTILANTVVQNGGDAAITFATIGLAEQADPQMELVAVEDFAPENIAGKFPDWPLVTYPFPGRFKLPFGTFVSKVASALARRSYRPLAHLYLASPWAFKTVCRVARPGHWRRHRKADVTLTVGGTYLIERYEFISKLLNVALAQMAGNKTVFITQSLGPFEDAFNREMVRRVLGQSDLVLLRDEASRGYLEDIGFDHANTHVVADSVFFLGQPEEWDRRDYTGAPKRVLVSVRDCTVFQDSPEGEERYRTSVAALVTHLVERYGCEITFRSTCQGVPAYHADDSKIANDICARLAPEVRAKTSVDVGFNSPSEFQSGAAAFDLAVSTRLHGAIQALNAATPVIPIAYEFKTREVWAGFGLSDHVLDLAPATPQDWIDVVDKVLAAPDGYAGQLAGAVRAATLSAGEAATHMKTVMAGGA